LIRERTLAQPVTFMSAAALTAPTPSGRPLSSRAALSRMTA